MHPALHDSEERLEIRLDNLRHAHDETEQRCEEIAAGLQEALAEGADREHGLDVVVFGSIARDEMSEISDFDFLVVAHKAANPDLFRRYRQAVRDVHLQMSIPPPGQSGLFGGVISPQELVDRIGLDSDTNLSHSRRILVLEESKSLLHPDRHEMLKQSIIERYLHDYTEERPRVPRFLTNDIVRYWHTVAVDYQAKRWEELEAKKWGLRYLKLRSTRKLTFASTLAAVMSPAIQGEDASTERLLAELDKPSLARLASLAPIAQGTSAEDPLRSILTIADQFIGWLGDHAWRTEMEAVVDPGADTNSADFHEARKATVDLHMALDALFHSDMPVAGSHPSIETLRDLTRHYLIF